VAGVGRLAVDRLAALDGLLYRVASVIGWLSLASDAIGRAQG
jgi:hypothetical protein